MDTALTPYHEGDDAFDALIVRPAEDGPRPAVLVCHAWQGRGAREERRAHMFAELGYVAAAVDVYGVGKRGVDADSSRALMVPLLNDPARLRRRLAAAFQAVRTLDEVDPDRVAVVGYCFGGLCAILCARMGLPIRGAVSFHGLLKIGEPLDAKVHGRILVQHGQDDPMAPPSDIGPFAEEMKRIDADWTLHAYPGVLHAFTDSGANDAASGFLYDADADAQSWRETARFLEDVFES